MMAGKKSWLPLVLLPLLTISAQAQANCTGPGCNASANSPILAKVLTAITLENISPLDFGLAVLGDARKTIQPAGRETLENASFLVRGEANSEYRILLPRNAILYNVDDAKDKIKISRFTSLPRRTGRINAQGQDHLYIGATRAAIKLDTMPGTYLGQFTITVLY